jgi:hypothetical protein
VKAEADRLNRRLAGWSYQIGSWKEKSLVPTIDDLKAEEPAAPPPSAATSLPDAATPAPDAAIPAPDAAPPPSDADKK